MTEDSQQQQDGKTQHNADLEAGSNECPEEHSHAYSKQPKNKQKGKKKKRSKRVGYARNSASQVVNSGVTVVNSSVTVAPVAIDVKNESEEKTTVHRWPHEKGTKLCCFC